MRSMSACAPGQTLKPGWWPLRFIGKAERRLPKPPCISPEIERQGAAAARDGGNRCARGLTSLRYSAMAIVSQTAIDLWVKRGTRKLGDRSKSSARIAGSSLGMMVSSNARPANLHKSHPLRDHEE